MTEPNTGRPIFLLSDGGEYPDHLVCGGKVGEPGCPSLFQHPCSHSTDGRFPGICVDEAGEVHCDCIAYCLGPLAYWQGHSGLTWRGELLKHVLFKCHANQWFLVQGLCGTPTVAEVDWATADPLGYGSFSAVFRVGLATVAKVGCITEGEVADQRWAAQQGWAIPVIDYQAHVSLPADLCREVCAVHGPRADIVPPDDYLCLCGGARLDVLLMPLAQELTAEEALSAEAQDLQSAVANVLYRHCGRVLDRQPTNIMRWRDRLVIVDFGSEQEYAEM